MVIGIGIFDCDGKLRKIAKLLKSNAARDGSFVCVSDWTIGVAGYFSEGDVLDLEEISGCSGRKSEDELVRKNDG